MPKRLRGRTVVLDQNGGLAEFGPNDVIPAWARAQITNPLAWEDGDGEDAAPVTAPVVGQPVTGDGGKDGDGKADAPKPAYAEMTNAELSALIAARNEKRDAGEAKLPTAGTKAELVATLQGDDEAPA